MNALPNDSLLVCINLLDDDRSIGRIFMRSRRGEKLAGNVFSSGQVLD